MRQSSARGAVRPRCLPKPPRVLNGAVNARGAIRLHCLRTCFPGGRVDCGGGGRGRWPLRPINNDYDVNNDVTNEVDSISEAEERTSSNTSAGAQGGSFLPDVPSCESTYHHTSGSSRASLINKKYIFLVIRQLVKNLNNKFYII